MKKGSMIFAVAAVLFVCGCNQNPQTVAMTTPAATKFEIQERLPGSLTPEFIPTPTPEPTSTATFVPTPALEPTPTEGTIPTEAPVVTPTMTPTPTLTPTPTPEPTATVTPTKTVNPLEGELWRELYKEDTKNRMTLSEISSLNEHNFRAKGTSLVKLSELEQMKASNVMQMIESYSFPKKKYYGNEVISEKTKTAILKLRNLDVLPKQGNAELKFGVLVQNAELRSFPAEKPLTSVPNGRYDYLQETVLHLNEAVVVLHTSADGAWCFVQGENYYGWIREETIAYCEKETMQKHYEALLDTENKNILLVTKNVKYRPEADVEYPLRMGTKLFCETKENGECLASVPVRDGDKQLQTKQYPISLEEKSEASFHCGYLPYTTSNVVTLATGLLDTPYAWGDSLPYKEYYSYSSETGMDCSSTVAAVYRCLGFVVPRNTGTQRASVWTGETVSNYKIKQKKEMLEQLQAGALLYSPGHVMLYLGSYEGEYYVLHNTTTEFLSDGTEKSYYGCVISPMSLGKKGNIILEQISEVKVP